MSVKNHLLDGETILDYCVTDRWAWIATDRRVMKYKKTDSGGEALRDVSYTEISGVSFNHYPKDYRYLVVGLIIATIGYLPKEPLALIAGFAVAAIPVYLWWNSEKSFFELRGTGLIQAEPEEWKIKESTDGDVSNFVKTIRGQL